MGHQCCSALECSPAARLVVGTYARIADPNRRLGLVLHWLVPPLVVVPGIESPWLLPGRAVSAEVSDATQPYALAPGEASR